MWAQPCLLRDTAGAKLSVHFTVIVMHQQVLTLKKKDLNATDVVLVEMYTI
jgi:hypothetical protein